MTITKDASTPAAVDNTGSTASTAATASFSPPANSMVVIVVNIGYASLHGTEPAVSVADSLSNSYTAGPSSYIGSAAGQYTGIFTHFYTAAPGSVTVTATRAGSGSPAAAALFEVVPYVLTGAAAAQAGAASVGSVTGTSTAGTHAITSTTAGSWVIAGVALDDNTSMTASVLTSDHTITNDSTDQEAAGAGHTVTGTPGAETIGYTFGVSSAFSWAALEILPGAATQGALLLKFP